MIKYLLERNEDAGLPAKSIMRPCLEEKKKYWEKSSVCHLPCRHLGSLLPAFSRSFKMLTFEKRKPRERTSAQAGTMDSVSKPWHGIVLMATHITLRARQWDRLGKYLSFSMQNGMRLLLIPSSQVLEVNTEVRMSVGAQNIKDSEIQ